jgi:MIP family channel proteins
MPNLRPLLAEFVGTFFLVFAGTGAIVSNTFRDGSLGLLGIAAAHGLALAIGVTAAMRVSGGHLNPAITLGLLSVGRVNVITAAQYIGAQLAGGIVASLAVKFLYPQMAGVVAKLGTPVLSSGITMSQGIVIEAILTFLLAWAVMGTAVDPDAPAVGGFGIGLTLFFAILAGGQLTGAAVNPARAFGPALVSGTWIGQAIWWIGPILGAVVAIQLYERMILRKA